MQNFQNHLTQSTNPTDPMSYIDFLDNLGSSHSSPFMAFMGYDEMGNSMRLDEYLFGFIKNNKSANVVHLDHFFDESFTGLLEPEETQRLLLDLIMFTQRFPDSLEFLRIDERHQPVFLIK